MRGGTAITRAALGVLGALVLGRCGLYAGGDTSADTTDGAAADGASADVPADLSVDDRGVMVDDGATCACVPPDAENAGWTYVGGAPMKGACPASWTNAPEAAVWDPQAAGYACACSCTPTLPTCTANNVAFHYGLTALCGASTSTYNGAVTLNSCTAFDQGNPNQFGFGGMVSVDGLAQSGGSCAPTSTPTKGTVTAKDAQLCGFSGTKSTCNNGDPCLPLPAAPYAMCVMKLEASPISACPPGFPKGVDGNAGPTHVGTATDDTGITCPSCACNGAPGTCGFGVDVFSDGSCSQNKLLFSATTSCQGDGQNVSAFNPRSFRVSDAPAISCSPVNAAPPPSGAAQLSGALAAICCR